MAVQNVRRCVGRFVQSNEKMGVKMIKLIASDLDGTLLNEHHVCSPKTVEMIKKAQKSGIRFMLATGRSFKQAEQLMDDAGIVCDYLVSSGAEVRNAQKELIFSSHMSMKDCKMVYEVLKDDTIPFLFSTKDWDYCIGTPEELEENVLEHIFAFSQSYSKEEIKKSPVYKKMMEKTKIVPDFATLEALELRIVKVFIFTNELEKLAEIKEQLIENKGIAVTSSFPNNLEITDIGAQKGPVLKKYIESLGYTMEEVMVFGDSLNDYSMLSMDFGATIAMENAEETIKQVSMYVTKSNIEDGVAYAIEKLLQHQT